MSKVFPSDYPVDVSLRMHTDKIDRYWFYHLETYPTDIPLKYMDLIKSAASSIYIWDPYFNIDSTKPDYVLFNNINDNVLIRILTVKKLAKAANINFLNDTLTKVKSAVSANDVEFGMRVINESEGIEKKWLFHDRFLIIDNNDFYYIGSSVGYHIYTEKSTGIYKITDIETKELIEALFEYYWDKGKANEIPIQFLHP